MPANGSGPGKKGIKWANEAGHSLEKYANNTTRKHIETKRRQHAERAEKKRAAQEERAEKKRAEKERAAEEERAEKERAAQEERDAADKIAEEFLKNHPNNANFRRSRKNRKS